MFLEPRALFQLPNWIFVFFLSLFVPWFLALLLFPEKVDSLFIFRHKILSIQALAPGQSSNLFFKKTWVCVNKDQFNLSSQNFISFSPCLLELSFPIKIRQIQTSFPLNPGALLSGFDLAWRVNVESSWPLAVSVFLEFWRKQSLSFLRFVKKRKNKNWVSGRGRENDLFLTVYLSEKYLLEF